jgi:hypothetical protein
MPTLYEFPLAVPAAGGNGVLAERFARQYAWTPARTSAGDMALVGSSVARGYPLIEIVRNVLTTEQGSFAGDPLFGVNTKIVRKAGVQTARKWQAEVTRALRFLVDSGDLTDLAVIVDPVVNGRMLYEVQFRDPVSGLVDSVRGLVVL